MRLPCLKMSLAENIFEHAKEEITMGIELRKAAVTDGMDIYEMLQELPANENAVFFRKYLMNFCILLIFGWLRYYFRKGNVALSIRQGHFP